MVPVDAPLGVSFREAPPPLPRSATSDRAIYAGRLSAGEVFTLEGLALQGGATCSAYSPYDLPDESMIRHRMQVGIKPNAKLMYPQKLTGLISLYTNPASSQTVA
jgi:hypothetical protein